VDKWDLQRSVDEGLGSFGFGFPLSLYEENGFSTGLFRTTDPVNRRTLMGVWRAVTSQAHRRLLFPWPERGRQPFPLARDGRAPQYGLRQQDGQLSVLDIRSRESSRHTTREFE
jgi:hypothetical protein